MPEGDRPGKLSYESQLRNGPFSELNRRVLVFSIGARNEGHGRALPSNIDDYMGLYGASNIAMRLGLTYVAHIPYSSDRWDNVATDWNPGCLPKQEFESKVIQFLKQMITIQMTLDNSPTHVVVVGGHGGNNFLADDDVIKRIEHELKAHFKTDIGFYYAAPFKGVKVQSTNKPHDSVDITHADDGEHSVAEFLGLVDQRKLEEINEVARRDPDEASLLDPPIMGLSYYTRQPPNDPRYSDFTRDKSHEALRERSKEFRGRKEGIVPDYQIGKRFMEEWIRIATNEIREHLIKSRSQER
jgi:creatinine amidohydrolase/Fe(II)-dependent formamide hydrolase-like protein